MKEMYWDTYFNEYVYKWMFHDIDVGITNNANYLAVLGLCAYIEVLGAIKNGNWSDSNKKDWGTFLNDMNPNYSARA